MKKLLLLLSVFTSSLASAQYVSEGPRGGTAQHFYVDAGKVWLAAGGGLFYSVDDGISWRLTEAQPIPANCEDLLSVAASGNEVYVGARTSGILHSTDAGRTWTLPGSGIIRGNPYTDIEIAGPNAIAIRGDIGQLLVTTDHGLSWTGMNFAIGNSAARSLCLHNNSLYVSTNMGLFKSTDNGLSYMNVNPILADTGELSWSHDTMYVASASGLKMSINDGVNFTPLGLAGTPLNQVAADGNRIYVSVSAAGQDTLKMSTDGGLNFTNAPFGPIPFSQVGDLTFTNGVALAGTDYGLFRSSTGPLQKADSGFNATILNGFAVNGIGLYAATANMGISYTGDSAEHWQNIAGRANGVPGNILSIDARNQFVYAGGLSGYFRSTNFGTSWAAGATGLPTGVINCVFSVKGTSDVIAIQLGNMYLSSNDGGSFAPLGSPVGANPYLLTQADTSLFLAGTLGFYKGNSSYNFVPTTGITGLVTAVAYYRNNYYASTHSNGLFLSPDGLTWTALNPAPGTLPQQINALAVKDTVLFVGTDFGLYSDSTGIWHQDSLQGKYVHSLAVANDKLYVGTCNGVWSLKNLPPPSGVGVGNVQRLEHMLTAFPNPTQNDLHVRFLADKPTPATLSLQDLMGRRVWSQSVNVQTGKNEWLLSSEIASLPAGVYFLQLNAGAYSAQQKIILQ